MKNFKIPTGVISGSSRLFLLVCFCLVVFSSCKDRKLPNHIKNIINSQANRSVLLQVIDHYSEDSADSLKLRATYFLISALHNRTYLTGHNLEAFQKYPELVLRDLDHGEFIMSSLSKIYGEYHGDSLIRKSVLQEATADQLIGNIDQAFFAWEQAPWHLDYNFDEFCQYILPYTIDREIPSYNRKAVYEQFVKLLGKKPDPKMDAVSATKIINDELIRNGWVLSNRASFLPNFSAESLVKNRIGTCRDMGDLAIFVMRAVGIPVATDFVPQWPYRSIGHNWNVVIDKRGISQPFLGAEDSPGTPHKAGTKKGKVYRQTITQNQNSLAVLAGKSEPIPGFLSDPNLVDVTDVYARTFTVSLHLQKGLSTNKFVYLCVFNNKDWIPIAWARRNGDKVEFAKMEGGIVYLPAFLDKKGFISAGHPFELDENGFVNTLNPKETEGTEMVRCNRVYPIVPEMFAMDEVKGAVIEGSNNSDFSSSKVLYQFISRGLPFETTLSFSKKDHFRYYRYLSAKNKPCQLAEISFLTMQGRNKGKVLADKNADDNILNNAFDGDVTTFYKASNNNTNIVIDYGQKTVLEQVKITPKLNDSPNASIVAGRKYELNYWANGYWKPIFTVVPDTNTIKFNGLPKKGLFLLKALSRSDESRIFTIDGGKQKWF